MAKKRLIRDFTDSVTVNQLSHFEEVVFVRLLMKADDHGKYHGDAVLLKAYLFPRKFDVTVDMIAAAVARLRELKLIEVYPFKSSMFILINGFGQRLRTMRSQFPDPEPTSKSADSCQPEVEVEVEVRSRSRINDHHSMIDSDHHDVKMFDQFWNLYDKKVGREKSLQLWMKIDFSKIHCLEIMSHVKKYIAAQPDKKFRKNPETYLRNQCWNDEIINNQNHSNADGNSQVRKSSVGKWADFAKGQQ